MYFWAGIEEITKLTTWPGDAELKKIVGSIGYFPLVMLTWLCFFRCSTSIPPMFWLCSGYVLTLFRLCSVYAPSMVLSVLFICSVFVLVLFHIGYVPSLLVLVSTNLSTFHQCFVYVPVLFCQISSDYGLSMVLSTFRLCYKSPS